MSDVELWLQSPPVVPLAGELAARAEKSGWHGVQFADGRSGDVFVCLTAAAVNSSRIKLATGVVNPIVRHPAVLASAIAGVARLAGERVVLGLGRGDSSVRILGLTGAAVPEFAVHLRDIQTYLSGGCVGGEGGPHVPWLVADPGAKVPVDVAATGPKVIDLAARLADRVTLALGAEPDKVRWGVHRVRDAAPERFVGAAIACGIDRDPVVAADLARGPLSVTTHFAAGASRGLPMSAQDAEVVRTVDRTYDYSEHSRGGSRQAKALPDEFVRRTGLVGSPEACVDRLQELIELGLDRIVLMTGSRAGGPRALLDEQDRIADQVLARL